MAFFSITYNSKYNFATLHNYGCVFKCPVCSYKLRSGANGKPGFVVPKPQRFLSTEEIKKTLRALDINTLYFMGGEPSIAPDIQELLDFGKETLNVKTVFGHCNGWKLSFRNLDGANIGLKAWDPEVHLTYTGRSKDIVFDNVKRAFDSGLELKINVVYIPWFVDIDQVEAIAKWVSALSRKIPFHIMGYIPVPGQPYERPSIEQMSRAVSICKSYLDNVGMSHLFPEDTKHYANWDDRFNVVKVL